MLEYASQDVLYLALAYKFIREKIIFENKQEKPQNMTCDISTL